MNRRGLANSWRPVVGLLTILNLVACDGTAPTEPIGGAHARAVLGEPVLAPTLDSPPSAYWEILAEPFTVTRQPGAPALSVLPYVISGREAFSDTVMVVLRDVSPQGRVSSGGVSLDGMPLWTSRAFPLMDRVDSTKVVALTSGLIQVTLNSKPGTSIELTLLGQFRRGYGRIGAEGGVLVASDGLGRLTVPPGALDAPTILGISEAALPDGVPNQQIDILSMYRFSPDGLVFNKKAMLERDIPVGTEGEYVGWYYEPGLGTMFLTEGTKASGGEMVSTEMEHFSWVVIARRPELSRLSSLPTKWGVRRFPSEYASTGVTDADFLADVAAALKQWETWTRAINITFEGPQAVPEVSIELEAVDPSANPTLRYYFGIGDETAAAVTGFNLLRGSWVVLFNDSHPWHVAPKQDAGTLESYQTLGVVLHEMGHNLGINDHLAYPNIMSETGSFKATPSLRCGDLAAFDRWAGTAYAGMCATRLVREDAGELTFREGEGVDPLPIVKLLDANGTPVPNVPVTLSARGAMASPAWALSGADGRVPITAWLPEAAATETSIEMTSYMLSDAPTLTIDATRWSPTNLFVDDFEYSAPPFPNGWIISGVGTGDPTTNTERSVSGTRSLRIPNRKELNLSLAPYDIASVGRISVWYYDDLQHYTGGVLSSNGSTFAHVLFQSGTCGKASVGIRNTPTYYILNCAGETPSSVQRTLGWHYFEWSFSSGQVQVLIDGQVVSTIALTSGEQLKTFFMNVGTIVTHADFDFVAIDPR